MAGEWAATNELVVIEVKANWEAYGRRAGVFRNIKMLEMYPSYVFAFPLPGSVGTRHAVKEARRRAITVIEADPGPVIYPKEPTYWCPVCVHTKVDGAQVLCAECGGLEGEETVN